MSKKRNKGKHMQKQQNVGLSSTQTTTPATKDYSATPRDLREATLFVPPWIAYDLSIAAAEASPQEIGWLGQIEIVKNGLLLNNIFLVKQTVTGGTFEWDEDAYDEWFMKIAMKDLELREKKLPEVSPNLCCVVHSHVNMGTFFSATDEEVNNSFANRPWMVALVLNTKGEFKAQIVYQEPIIAKQDLKVSIADKISPLFRPKQEIVAEVKAKAKHETYATTTYVYGSGTTVYSDFGDDCDDLYGYGYIESYKGKATPGTPGGVPSLGPYEQFSSHVDPGSLSYPSLTERINDQLKDILPCDCSKEECIYCNKLNYCPKHSYSQYPRGCVDCVRAFIVDEETTLQSEIDDEDDDIPGMWVCDLCESPNSYEDGLICMYCGVAMPVGGTS